MTGPALTAQYTYEPHRNLITSVTNQSVQSPVGEVRDLAAETPAQEPTRPKTKAPDRRAKDPISSYVYTNDLLGRRDEITHGGLAFQQLKFGDTKVDVAYNDRSEVIGANYRSGDEISQSYQYAYDGIGNRETYEAKGQWEEAKLGYSSNLLNQYQKITGTPDSNNLAPGDSQSPPAAQPPSEDRRKSAPISGSPLGDFAHDLDGNLLEDSRNRYTWNAENRLTTVESKDNKTKVSYAYDYQGRRTVKKTFVRKNSSEDYTLQASSVYLYDGWNLLAELEENHQSQLINHQCFTWGRDLSGSLQGAGGVGGLLAITEGREHRYPAYDANGNVGQLVDEVGGLKAAYIYDPFGNVTESVGAEAETNRWRFSTKPVEEATGWSYYGFRYCAPSEAWHLWQGESPCRKSLTGGSPKEQALTRHPYRVLRE